MESLKNQTKDELQELLAEIDDILFFTGQDRDDVLEEIKGRK